MSEESKGITLEEFTADLIAMEDGIVEDAPATQDDSNPEQDIEATAETHDTDADVDDDYLAEVDEDEADDNPEEESEEADEDDSEEEAEDREFTFKADGEEVTVTLNELKKSYGLQKNLTRKGQELAEKEKLNAQESEIITYYKQTPERQKLMDEIGLMEKALDRGYMVNPDGTPAKGEDGQIIYLSKEQMDAGPKMIGEARAKLSEFAPLPMQDRAQKEIPELWSSDARVRDTAIKQYESYLMSVGYTQAELAHISPRELLLAKAALKGDELATRVEAAKARRAKKPKAGVVSKVTKAAKGKPETSNKRGDSGPKLTEQQIADKVNSGEMNIADAFLDLD